MCIKVVWVFDINPHAVTNGRWNSIDFTWRWAFCGAWQRFSFFFVQSLWFRLLEKSRAPSFLKSSTWKMAIWRPKGEGRGIQTWIYFIYLHIRPQQLSFKFTIKDIVEVDTDKHKISFSILTYINWQEPQASCRREVHWPSNIQFCVTFFLEGVSGKADMQTRKRTNVDPNSPHQSTFRSSCTVKIEIILYKWKWWKPWD